jgi:acyl-CoA synthetase (AMP-forming)/AMP-acid ligase II
MDETTSESTLCSSLTGAAARRKGGLFFHLGDAPVAVPVAELYEAALKRAAQLGRAGIGIGDMVGLLGPNCPQWAEWAWGTWLAGCVLVPLPAPLRVRDPAAFSSQVASLAGATGCSIVVGEGQYLDFVDGEDCPKLDWSCEAPPAPHQKAAEVQPSDLAMVLCTSGSTAAPKGVRMTHARAMVWARHTAAKVSPGTVPVVVSWLPFYHIGGLGPVFEFVAPVDWHVLPMARFARDPAEWLRLVGETRALSTVGPSSAWAAALRGLAKRPEGVDLSCLKGAVFNAETVDPDVAGRIAEVCVPLGLNPRAINVHYASSEAGMITHTEPCEELRVDVVDLEELASSSRASAPRAGRPVKRIVSCGVAFPGVELRIGSPDDALPERHLGEVWVRGEGVTDGYVNTGSEGLFMGDWLRIGDLGYMAEGELFVTGRSNEVIVRLGQKYHPEDIEQAVQRATGLAPGSCVAFSPLEGRQGDLVVVVEADTGDAELAGAVSTAITNAIGLTPSQVLVVPTGTVPTTPNGKLQRARARYMHRRGELAPPSADLSTSGADH